MSEIEQSTAMDLIKKARDLGLVGGNETISCFNCNVVFPNSYEYCPNCNSSKS